MIDDNGIDWEWCPDCRTQRVVTDRSAESTIEGAYMRRSITEVEYVVTYLSCGHQKSNRAGSTTYRDPGA